MLHVCSIAVLSQGLILNSERPYATFGTKIPDLRSNAGCLLGNVQNGKKDGFTKMSVES